MRESILIETNQSIYTQLKPLLEMIIPAIATKLQIVLQMQSRLRGFPAKLSDDAFLDYWRSVSHLQILTVKEIVELDTISVIGRKLTLNDIRTWNEDYCHLSNNETAPIINLFLKKAVEKLRQA